MIVEYVEGIQVVKAFSQGERSYQKFAQAVASFRDFTMGWFRCTWASMNLCLSILPTTLLGTLPAGVALYQAGILDPAQVTLCLMLALGIVSPLMSATAFINSMKSMQFAVKDTRELLNLPQLTQAEQNVHLEGSSIQMQDVSFSYGGTEGKEVLRHLDLTIPQGKFTALVGPSGGGKSTIARLTARFWDVTGGSITLGGQDLKRVPLKQLYDQVAFVSQDNYLFDESIRENIRMGRPAAPTPRWRPWQKPPGVTPLSAVWNTAMTRWWAEAAPICPEASVSASPSPGPCSRTRPLWCWTRRPLI